MPYDCQTCGACCFSDSSAYVPVTETDRARLGAGAAALVCEEDGARYMAMQRGHCVALRVVGPVFVCSVYARRPAVCAELHRATPACREERKLKRLAAARLL